MSYIENTNQFQVLSEVISKLETEKIAYCLIDTYALNLYGIDTEVGDSLTLSIQWDLFPKAYEIFSAYGVSEWEKLGDHDSFSFVLNDVRVTIVCYFNTVIETDPYRMNIIVNGLTISVKSLDYFLKKLSPNDEYYVAIKNHLNKLQQVNSSLNEEAWNTEAYNAWLNRFGTPEEAATQIKKDPKSKIKAVFDHLGDLEGKRVINLLGSHGAKAISMALLGADSTVVDISKENEKYATEVADAAGVDLTYIISDVLNLPEEVFETKYDIVLMELGVLHYFIDLEPLFTVMKKLLRVGGRVVIQDFHPISTKLITSKGKKHKVTGNYFDKTMEVRNVAFSKHLDPMKKQEVTNVYLRKWTLGEIVTSVASTGLFIKVLEEDPNTKIADIGLPKTFTLVAEKL